MNTTPPFTDDLAGPIVDALTDFVKVHQILLSTVIGKQSIFAQFLLTAPIAAALRALESEVDFFAFSLIALIPTRTSSVKDCQQSLDSSLGDAIAKYQAICIPSVLYPAIPPVCVSLTL
ncbi:hypothetical protein JR316_0012039 [Psilocybe cubensis]|nr:hypothetical protein JR316_0012039 [Psilocybe cubensis]KAH9474941.1 hypothetical protein JR316_0012039 [Psilocybe cubensis]